MAGICRNRNGLITPKSRPAYWPEYAEIKVVGICRKVTARGFVYLTAVIDVASRCVLAHRVATTLEACHAVEALEQAFARHGTPEIVNTDQGSQPGLNWSSQHRFDLVRVALH